VQTGSDTIICSRCGAENPAQRKTCQRCWGLLRGPICPHCGKRATRAGARFCEHCDGDLHAGPAVRESRPVTPPELAGAEPTGSEGPPVVTAPFVEERAPAAELPTHRDGSPRVEPPALELPSVELSAVEPPAAETPAGEPQVHAPPPAPQPAAPERFVAKGLARTSAAEDKEDLPPPLSRPADAHAAGRRPSRQSVRRRPVGLLISAAGLVIILGLAFLGGVALQRQRAATDLTATGNPQRSTGPAPRAAATRTQSVVVPAVTPSGSPAAPPAAGGTLRVTTDPPGAQVELDGVAVGVTTLTLNGVAPGRRTVRISRSGFRVESRELEITAGETAVVNVTLSATPAPATPRRRPPSGPPLPPPPLPPPP
jgi:hypothetical protein